MMSGRAERLWRAAADRAAVVLRRPDLGAAEDRPTGWRRLVLPARLPRVPVGGRFVVTTMAPTLTLAPVEGRDLVLLAIEPVGRPGGRTDRRPREQAVSRWGRRPTTPAAPSSDRHHQRHDHGPAPGPLTHEPAKGLAGMAAQDVLVGGAVAQCVLENSTHH